MRKVLSLILVVVMSMSFIACKPPKSDINQTRVSQSDNLLETLNITYLGGLYARSETNDMMLALFKSSDMPIAIITEYENLYYGEYTTKDVTLIDGTKYTEITVEGKKYGYHFNDDMTGILVDQQNNMYEAKMLDVSVATDMVRRTLDGK